MQAPECSVCLEEYEEPPSALAPTALPCGHTLCKGCSQTLAGGTPLILTCPTCQHRAQIPAAGLPCNYAIVAVINDLASKRFPGVPLGADHGGAATNDATPWGANPEHWWQALETEVDDALLCVCRSSGVLLFSLCHCLQTLSL